jgi:hypothetical protein
MSSRIRALLYTCFFVVCNSPGQQSLHENWTIVLQRHVDDGRVDYEMIANDSLFFQYLDLLSSTNPDSLPLREDVLALWLNAYNAYTIKLIVDRMPLESIRDISLGLPILFGPWSIDVANVGGRVYTLNEIEHDIIRARYRDPRVHFALVCASLGCPKLRKEAYEGGRVNEQLDDDARRFIGDPSRNRFDPAENTIYISKIFDWYESDFEESAGSVKKFIARYVPPQDLSLIALPECDVEFLDYDWSLNKK